MSLAGYLDCLTNKLRDCFYLKQPLTRIKVSSVKDSKQIKKIIKKSYTNITNSSCSCGCSNKQAQKQSGEMGYSDEEMNQVPDGSNLGIGCGNPVAIASLKSGEVVLNLGSGAFDVFLAVRKVGKTDMVIGVDMTDEMLEKARKNAKKAGFDKITIHKETPDFSKRFGNF